MSYFLRFLKFPGFVPECGSTYGGYAKRSRFVTAQAFESTRFGVGSLRKQLLSPRRIAFPDGFMSRCRKRLAIAVQRGPTHEFIRPRLRLVRRQIPPPMR